MQERSYKLNLELCLIVQRNWRLHIKQENLVQVSVQTNIVLLNINKCAHIGTIFKITFHPVGLHSFIFLFLFANWCQGPDLILSLPFWGLTVIMVKQQQTIRKGNYNLCLRAHVACMQIKKLYFYILEGLIRIEI